jgi:hypothetical protein
MSRQYRLLAGATIAALAVTSLVGASSPTQAVVATQTVTFQDCDLTKGAFEIGSPVSVTTPITLEYPSPVAAGSTQTASMTLGTLPGNTFPDDFADLSYVGVSVQFEDDDFSTRDIFEEHAMPSFDASAPLVLGEFESDQIIYYSGFYDFKPKSLEIYLYGDPGTGSLFYTLECNQVVNPANLLTVAVFDPAADAAISLDRLSTKQGGKATIAGVDFAHESPDDPDSDVAVTVGGIPAGAYDVDETGAFSGPLRIPAFVKPGDNVVVRATSGNESATQVITVKAGKGKVSVSPGKVKAGKKLTIRASAFKPGETVKVSLTGGKGKGKKAFSTSVKVSAAGTATKTVKLKKAAKGKWTVKVAGPQSFRSAKKAFKVS